MLLFRMEHASNERNPLTNYTINFEPQIIPFTWNFSPGAYSIDFISLLFLQKYMNWNRLYWILLNKTKKYQHKALTQNSIYCFLKWVYWIKWLHENSPNWHITKRTDFKWLHISSAMRPVNMIITVPLL